MPVRQRVLSGVIGIAIAMSSTVYSPALAKRISYAEAWRLCKAEMDKDRVLSSWASNDRYLRGGACMHKYGYRL